MILVSLYFKKTILLRFFNRIFLNIACTVHSRDCNLNLHYDHGFTLNEISTNTQLWHQSFDKLKSSSDNNHRLLILNFYNEEGEIVS